MASSNTKRGKSDSSELTFWFQAACSRTPGAIQQLLALYRPLMLKLANQQLGRAVRSKVAPSDLVQTTLWKASQAFEKETFGNREAFLAWLITILNHEAANVGRRYRKTKKRDIRRERSFADPDTRDWLRRLSASLSQSEASDSFVQDRLDNVLDALATLPAHYQLVLRLRYFEKLGFEAIGQKLERSKDASRVLHNRALAKLREKLLPSGAEGDDSEAPT